MTEAKKRNPDIKLYGLPWAFPAWVGGATGNPFSYPNQTAGYIVKWVQGAHAQYNLTIDYVVRFVPYFLFISLCELTLFVSLYLGLSYCRSWDSSLVCIHGFDNSSNSACYLYPIC
jgi:hypothetical protein